ncbi:MAG TPA: hypothetical protein VFJ84_02500 [Candidatus Saccharimonadales bacterium]|nr:hypothetical protein [Candidatus Saccharimonadales bacterium]
MPKRLIRLSFLTLAAFFCAASLLIGHPASAITVTDRSIVLSSNLPSASASHDFKFTIPSTADIGSIKFEYCSNSPSFYKTCTVPAGLDVSAASLLSQSGNPGFTVNSALSTPNQIIIHRTAAPGLMVPSEYVFGGITNPSTPGESVFVKISTHTAEDASDANIDTGAVAFAVQSIFNVNAYVPPFLQMCVGVTVAPNCSSMSGDSVDLGLLLSTRPGKGQSQFAIATNDPNGYVVYAMGTTLTSGSNIIPALPTPTTSIPGTGQFGINLRANLNPVIGQNPVGIGTGAPAPAYNIPNRFTYIDGDSITTSILPSDYNRMTVSYMANVPKTQPPGIYSTTITYVATVQF